MTRLAKIIAASAAAAVGFTGVAVGVQASPVIVERVVDGDTIEVRMLDKTVRVRLLNIDAPETRDSGQPTECLGPEASEFLENRLPVGTRVDLQYDKERYDKYGRTLAGVFESGSLVNAEIAAAGLGAPLLFEPNDRFYSEVLAAAEQAEAKRVGAYAPEVDCTLPSQIRAAAAALVASDVGDDGWSENQHLLAVGAINDDIHRASLLRAELASEESAGEASVNAFYSDDQRRDWLAELDAGIAAGRAQQADHQLAAAEIREAERMAAEKAEAERIAAEKAEAERIAAEKAEAERIAAEKAEAERIAAEKAEAERIAKAKVKQTVTEKPSNVSSVYYANCTAARKAGAAPVRRGDPGYGKHLDRDNDGIGCER